MTVTINGSGTITGVSTMGTTVVNQTLTTPTITSTMGVGNATPASSGAGITFPASQSASSNANTLDDYEEGSGTWSSVQKDGAGAGVSLATNQYDYIKIGRFVYLRFRVQISTPTTASAWRLNGLPFVNYNADAAVGVSLGEWQGMASKVYGGSTNIDVYVSNATGTASTWVYLYGSITYYTDN